MISRKLVDRIIEDGPPCHYEIVWTDEVGDIPVCLVHGNNSRYEKSTYPYRPCVTVDPWPEDTRQWT